MNTCGECNWFSNGKCMQSGFLGCKDEGLLKVKDTDVACITHYEEKED